MFSFKEKPTSPETTMEPPTITQKFCAAGEADQDIVRAYALGATPGLIATDQGVLYRQDVRIMPEGYNLFEVSIPYAKQKRENGSYRLGFSTLGGTVHIKAGKGTVAKFPPTAPDAGGLIGVKGAGEVDGTEIVIPAGKLVANFKHPLGVISLAQIKNLMRKTAYVNDRPFLTFDEGEVLFLGAEGEEGTDTETTVAYHLAVSENATGLKIGDIADIAKQGHDVAWIKYREEADDGKPTVKPQYVYVERVYARGNLAAILGFGG